MVKPARFALDQEVFSRDHDLGVKILWEYYPGCTGTYYDPPEPSDIQMLEFEIPDILEPRREEVRWLIEDQMDRLSIEAFETVERIYKKWREPHGI